MNEKDYQLGLLYLVHLLINADGVVNENEQNALLKIRDREKIPTAVFEEFLNEVKVLKPREIYQNGIDRINTCDEKQKLKAFVHLLKISEVDGSVHVKEVRLLLYSIKMADVEFNDVVAQAAQLKDY
jgi:uncharacterized tellurite resistance protein B-like protein